MNRWIMVPGLDGGTQLFDATKVIGAVDEPDVRGSVISLDHPAAVLIVRTSLSVKQIYELLTGEPATLN